MQGKANVLVILEGYEIDRRWSVRAPKQDGGDGTLSGEFEKDIKVGRYQYYGADFRVESTRVGYVCNRGRQTSFFDLLQDPYGLQTGGWNTPPHARDCRNYVPYSLQNQ